MKTTKICLACTTGHHGDCPVNCIEDGQGYVCECNEPRCIEERKQLTLRKEKSLQTAGAPVSGDILG